MPTSWFSVENSLIDRNDLTIFEKMCSVVLARYAGRAEFSNMLNIQVIAIRMGCSVKDAEIALNSLIAKKLVTLEDADRIEPELILAESFKAPSKVIKSEVINEPMHHTANAFETLESFDEEPAVEIKPKKASKAKKAPAAKKEVAAKKTEKVEKAEKKEEPAEEKTADSAVRPLVPKQVREGVQDLIDQIFEIIDENINDREARIILSFANNDIELIREKYKVAQRSQVSDKIEMLINELQKKDEPILGKQGSSEETAGVVSSTKGLQKAQVDLESINRMVALKQSSYGKTTIKGK